jgi:hypothetical protein
MNSGVVHSEQLSRQEIEKMMQFEQSMRQEIMAIELSFGSAPRWIHHYRKEYLKSFKDLSPQVSTWNEIEEKIKSAQVILVSDEHISSESQDNTRRVVAAMAEGASTGAKDLSMVIEWIDVSHQKYVDRYLAGKIELSELKEKLKFKKWWGFSWNSYKRILLQAKRLGVRVLAGGYLKNSLTLRERDRAIAERISLDKACRGDSARYLVAYGVYHLLGKNHLKDQLARVGLKPGLVIVEDIDHLYWKALLEHRDTDSVKQLRLSEDTFFIETRKTVAMTKRYHDWLLTLSDSHEDGICEHNL